MGSKRSKGRWTSARFASKTEGAVLSEKMKFNFGPALDLVGPAFDEFLSAKRASGCAEKTIRAYRHDLVAFARFVFTNRGRQVALENFEPRLVSAWCGATRISTATMARRIAALRSFSKWMFRAKIVREDLLADMAPPRVRSKPPKYLSETEYRTLLEHVSTSEYVREILPGRDFAILVMFIATGIRLSELIGIRISDIRLIDEVFVVTRKGGQQQTLPIPHLAIGALKKWILYREKFMFGLKVDALFVSNHRRPMNAQTIRNICKKWLARAGFGDRRMSPHALRHTFATAQINFGTPIHVVKELMGHASVESTMRYLHVKKDDLRQAVNRMKMR